MEFVCYADWNQLPDSAMRFLQRQRKTGFFSQPWLESLVNTVLANDQSMLLAYEVEENNVLAILPLMKGHSEHWHALTHLYSSLIKGSRNNNSLFWDADPSRLAALRKLER